MTQMVDPMPTFDYKSDTNLHIQVSQYLADMFAKGGWRQNDRLPSYRTLAKDLDVSVATVRKAVNELVDSGMVTGRPGKGMFLRQPIPNRTRRLKSIGLVSFCSRYTFFNQDYLMQILKGILLQSDADTIDVKLFSLRSDRVFTPEEYNERGLDGVVLMAVSNEDYLRAFARYPMPVVAVDCFHPEVPLDFIACDNRQAGRHCVGELIRLGHRRIAYVDGWSTDPLSDNTTPARPVESSDTVERRQAYFDAMIAQGLEPVVFQREGHERWVEAVVERWVAMADRPTALISYGAKECLQLAEALEACGVRIPENLSAVAMASSEPVIHDNRIISSCRMDFMEMGKDAVKCLKKRCTKLRPEKAQISRIGFDWIEGDSIGSIG